MENRGIWQKENSTCSDTGGPAHSLGCSPPEPAPVTSGNPAQGHRHSPNMRRGNNRAPRTDTKFPADLAGTLHPLDAPAPLTRAGRPWQGMCDCQRKPMVSHLIASRAVPTLPWQEPGWGVGGHQGEERKD